MEEKQQLLRDTLENELVQSMREGDTTVLAELLTLLTDEQVFNALSDEAQNRFPELW